MNGPEHYAEAERLLGLAMLDEHSVEDGYLGEIAAAQVHAALALAAATITAGAWADPRAEILAGAQWAQVLT